MAPTDGEYKTLIAAYRRIEKAYHEGRGVRLTADEVRAVYGGDWAIRHALASADEEGGDDGE